MKKLLSIVLSLTTLLTSLNWHAAATSPAPATIQPLHPGCSVKVQWSKDTSLHSNSDRTCFYLDGVMLTLVNPEKVPDGCVVVVRVKHPKLIRKASKLFLKSPENIGENRFSIKVANVKYSWFDILGKICSYFKDTGIYIPYVLVPLSMPENKKLNSQMVKEGSKKKSFEDAEKFKKIVEEVNGKPLAQQAAELYEAKLFNILNKKDNKKDILELAKLQGLDLDVKDDNYDPSNYYTFPEAQIENKKRAEEREKIEAKLAEIADGPKQPGDVVCILSKENPVQPIRLVINNNIYDGGQADLLALLLANQATIGQSVVDDSIVTFDYTIESVSKFRLENPVTEEEKAAAKRAYALLEQAKRKPSLFAILDKFVPSILKDSLRAILNIVKTGKVNDTELTQQISETKNKESTDTKKTTDTNQNKASALSRFLGLRNITTGKVCIAALSASAFLHALYFVATSTLTWVSSISWGQLTKLGLACLPLSLVVSIAKFLWNGASAGADVARTLAGRPQQPQQAPRH